MTSIEAKRLAQRIARIEREQANQGKPQLAYSSIENGNLKSYEGNDLKMVVGLQDDGGQATTVFNGPTPPTPTGYTVTVDHGSLTVHWDGDFEGGVVAPSDWARWTAYAQEGGTVTPSRSTAIGGTDSASGGEVTAGVLKGQWTVTVLAWSQAGKPSVMGDPVTVDVPGYGDIVLAEIDAADTIIKNGSDILVTAQDTLGGKLDSAFGSIDSINDDMSDLGDAVAGAVASANGKNTVTYDERPPTPADDGIAGDSWFVGEVGRPDDVVQATNNVLNPNALNGTVGWRSDSSGFATFNSFQSSMWGGYTGRLFYFDDKSSTRYPEIRETSPTPIEPGAWLGVRANVATESGLGVRVQVHWTTDGSTTHYTATSWHLAPFYSGLVLQDALQAPDGVNGYLLQIQLNNSSLGRARLWARRIHASPADSESAALAAVATYFDGDTPDGATDNDPHYRWTGTPHASTSEKYLPATDGLSSNWNVVAQYRHDGTNWVEVELSHHVISSADVGKLVAGSATIKEAVVQKLFAEVVVSRMSVADEFIGENAILDESVTAPKIVASEELWAKLAQFVTVYAEMVDSDVFNGRVFRGSTFLTTNDSSWSDAGLFLNDVDGSPRIQAPTDGSDFTVNAEVVAKSLTATGRASFLSDNNRLEPGAGLVLAAGVGDPPSPPVMSTYWPTIKPPALEGEETVSGLAYGDGLFWRAVDAGFGNNDLDRIEGIDRAGVVQKTIPLVDFWARNGLTVIGDEIFALGIRDDLPESTRNSSRWVRVFGLDGTYKRQWEYTEYGTGTYHPGIGRDDAGNLVIAQCWKEGDLTWRTYNKTTGALLAEVDRDDATKSDITGAYIGNGDLGAKHAFVAKKSTSTIQVFATDGAATSESWYTAAREEPLGLAWDGTKFHTLNTAGGIYEYGGPNMGDGTNEWWAVYRWAAVVDGQLDLSSRISPPARFPWPRRAQLKVGAPNLPEGADSIAPSLAHKPGTPSRTDFHSPAWGYTEGEPSAHYYELPTDWETYSTPQDSNNFPDGDPSALEAASGLFEVKGDGSGRWGPLTFNTDGTMSSNAVPDWIPVTTFRTGFAPQTWGYVPAYRIWPDGKVEWRGVIAGSVTTTVAALTVPVAARPPHPVNLLAATNAPGGADASTRIEFGQMDEPDIMRIYRGSADRTWVSIDGAYYYLE